MHIANLHPSLIFDVDMSTDELIRTCVNHECNDYACVFHVCRVVSRMISLQLADCAITHNIARRIDVIVHDTMTNSNYSIPCGIGLFIGLVPDIHDMMIRYIDSLLASPAHDCWMRLYQGIANMLYGSHRNQVVDVRVNITCEYVAKYPSFFKRSHVQSGDTMSMLDIIAVSACNMVAMRAVNYEQKRITRDYTILIRDLLYAHGISSHDVFASLFPDVYVTDLSSRNIICNHVCLGLIWKGHIIRARICDFDGMMRTCSMTIPMYCLICAKFGVTLMYRLMKHYDCGTMLMDADRLAPNLLSCVARIICDEDMLNRWMPVFRELAATDTQRKRDNMFLTSMLIDRPRSLGEQILMQIARCDAAR